MYVSEQPVCGCVELLLQKRTVVFLSYQQQQQQQQPLGTRGVVGHTRVRVSQQQQQ